MIYRRIEAAFAVLGLFYTTGAAIMLLTPQGGAADGAPAYRMLGVALGMISILLMARMPGILDRVMRDYWPILLLTILVLMSGFWSPSPDLAFRRSGALALTVAFAIYLTERYDQRTIFNLLLTTALITCIGSYVAVFAFPTFGIHQGGEPIPGFWQLFNDNDVINAGAWRGLFDHKNNLGRFAALAAVLFLIALLTRQKGRLLSLLALILAIVLIVQARSSQAILLLVVPGSVLLLVALLDRLDPRGRAMTLLLLLPLGAAAILLWNEIFAEVLGVLGKDSTLTGRTKVWSLVLEGLRGNYLFGAGYGTGMIQVQPVLARGMGGNQVDNPHNGYLGVLVDIGLVGLGLTLAIYAGVIARSCSRLFSGHSLELALMGIGFTVFTLFGNIVGSFLFDYNSIFSVLLVMLWGLLRRQGAPSRLAADPQGLAREARGS